jgi:hypothetical protein
MRAHQHGKGHNHASEHFDGPQARAGEAVRQRRRSRERPWTKWTSRRVLLCLILSFGTLASALTYTVLHHNQRCLTRKQTAVASSGRGPKRRHWRRDNLAAELRFRQQCKSAFGGAGGAQRVRLRTVAIVGAPQQACLVTVWVSVDLKHALQVSDYVIADLEPFTQDHALCQFQ